MNMLLFDADEWGKTLAPDDRRTLHVRKVLQLSQGDKLRIGMVGLGLGEGTILSLGEGGMQLLFPNAATLAPGPALLPVHLILGHPRPPVLQRLLRDLAPLGVSTLQVVISELCEKSYLQSHLWTKAGVVRWLYEGMEQAQVVQKPQLQREFGVRRTLGSLTNDSLRILCDTQGTPPTLLERVQNLDGSRPIVVAVGPERGWTEDERQAFLAAGFLPASLGSTTLRTETAVMLACGIAALACGRGGDRHTASSTGQDS